VTDSDRVAEPNAPEDDSTSGIVVPAAAGSSSVAHSSMFALALVYMVLPETGAGRTLEDIGPAATDLAAPIPGKTVPTSR
jgi:hypothetical protein